MARTEQEIYDEIDTERQAKAELAVYNSPSSVALFRLWQWVVAKTVHVFEKNLDNHQVEIEEFAATVPPGTPQWYNRKAKEFQDGDTLEVINDVPTYAVIDEAKQIIKHSALVGGNDLILKVAKEVAGALEPLDNTAGGELERFVAYINAIKFAGTRVSVLSLEADLLRAAGTFYYDSQYELADVKGDLDAKVDAYLKALPYNGRLYQMKFEDAIQSALGYNDLELTTLEATAAASVNWQAIPLKSDGRYYVPLAGYIKMDQPLSDVLTFKPIVPNV